MESNKIEDKIKKYKVICSLGEGSFGRVYKAKLKSDSSFVALKVISKRGRSPKDIESLQRECEIQRTLHHPNIIQMLESFEGKDEIVVVTEFATKDLKSILDKVVYLSEEKVEPIVWDLVSALYYLHSHRVLHRDLKPQNILMDSRNRAKLCDFGFARNMSTGTHVLTSIKGTPLYMAPELIEEQPYDHNADLWSLGCIVYELLVGATPFCSASILHLIRLIKHEEIQWPAFVSEQCVSFLKGLLQKDPSKRFTWLEILIHPFVKGHILIPEDTTSATNMPLTKTMSTKTLQIKEQQRKDCASYKVDTQAKSNIPAVDQKSSTKTGGASKLEKSETPNKYHKPVTANKIEGVQRDHRLVEHIESKKDAESSSKDYTDTSLITTQSNGTGIEFNLIEEDHPIETEEWIVFLEESMAELIKGEMTSLTQPNLMNVIVAPLRNCNTQAKVLCHVARLLSIPFAMKTVPSSTLEEIRKVYLEVKLIPNLLNSSKLFLRIRDKNNSDSPSVLMEEEYKNVTALTEDEFESLEAIYTLVTHLVYLENYALSQFCDAVAILNLFSLMRLFLTFGKSRWQVVSDVLAILNQVMRVFPEHHDLIHKIVFFKTDDEEKCVDFVELLRHNSAHLRENSCFFILMLGKSLQSSKMQMLLSRDVRETLEALVYDSIEGVRNAAEKAVDEFKNKDWY